MEKFKSLSNESVDVVEASIREKWSKDDILNKCIENRKDAHNFVFYDGPATANGHCVWGSLSLLSYIGTSNGERKWVSR